VAVETRIITPIALRSVDGDPENPFGGKKALFLARLTLVDSRPVLMEHLYLQAVLFAGMERLELEGRSLSTLAEEQFYLRPVGGRQSFGIGYADQEGQRHLAVTAQTPVLVVKRSLHFPQMANGVFSHLWCRTDQFVFTQNIGGVQHA
jgi:GntR family transcriptional regulator